VNDSTLPIELVRVPAGRRALRNVEQLADSIRELGLLNPITVTPGGVLLTGYHRLEACKLLGWEEIPVCVFEHEAEAEDLPLWWELAEIDENLMRTDLELLERCDEEARRKRVYDQLHPETKAGVAGGKARQGSATEIISFAEDTAAKTGVTARTVRQEVQIAKKILPEVKDVIRGTELADSKTDLLQLARLKPDEQRAVAETLKSEPVETVKQAINALRKAQTTAHFEASTTAAPQSEYHCIVVDPPWAYNCRSADVTHRARNPYPDMGTDAIAALEIPAADDCVLWLWTTNAFMHDAYHIAEGWGFTVKTILTWAKDKLGLGDWLRGQTEHCLMCVRGTPRIRLTNQTTLLVGPLREHSRKPDEFYALVDALCIGRKLEMFARTTREGWDAHGNETDKF
jgi:N6-adenosine-specific RNA methylase IME4/ParB-like chromosome segregation protein Spo0J